MLRRLQRFGRFLLRTIAALVFTETVRIFTMQGSFDIEDILLNLTGACIGFACGGRSLFRIAADGAPQNRKMAPLMRRHFGQFYFVFAGRWRIWWITPTRLMPAASATTHLTVSMP